MKPDEVDCGSGKRKKRLGQPRRRPNAWTLSLGRNGELACGHVGTKRPLEAMVLSVAADKQLRESYEECLQARAVCRPPGRWVFVGRARDTTPISVAVGVLRKHDKFKITCGIAELLAQAVQFCWLVLARTASPQPRAWMCKCCFGSLNQARVVTLQHGLGRAMPELAAERLVEVAGSFDFIFLAFGSDSASSCQRLDVIVGALL